MCILRAGLELPAGRALLWGSTATCVPKLWTICPEIISWKTPRIEDTAHRVAAAVVHIIMILPQPAEHPWHPPVPVLGSTAQELTLLHPCSIPACTDISVFFKVSTPEPQVQGVL